MNSKPGEADRLKAQLDRYHYQLKVTNDPRAIEAVWKAISEIEIKLRALGVLERQKPDS